MDSYDFSRYMGRPVSPPLPEDYSMGYLPQMPAYGDTSPSGRSSGVPQPIDFGGSSSGFSGASQRTSSQGPRIHQPEERAAAVARWRASGKTQKDFAESIAIPRTTFRQWIIEADYPTRSNIKYPPEEKSAALRQWHASKETETQSEFSRRIGVPLATLRNWIRKENNSSKGAR